MIAQWPRWSKNSSRRSPDYQKDDLITRSQIEKVVAKLVSDGVKISDPASIAKRGLADDSFLVRELSTPSGKRFMRKIAPRSGAYSHLDRLSTIPRGRDDRSAI